MDAPKRWWEPFETPGRNDQRARQIGARVPGECPVTNRACECGQPRKETTP